MLDEKPRAYHHGDLRHALLQAAEDVLTAEGLNGLTLREVARKAGVSHNAPYNHFADKAALIAALVEDAFKHFSQALYRAYDETPGNPLDKVMALGSAYVRFAVEHPPLFRIMFRPELCGPEKLQLASFLDAKSGDENDSFHVLVNGLADCQREGLVRPGDLMLLSLSAWSLVHGLAMMILDGPAGGLAQTPDEAAALAQRVVGVLRQGLAQP